MPEVVFGTYWFRPLKRRYGDAAITRIRVLFLHIYATFVCPFSVQLSTSFSSQTIIADATVAIRQPTLIHFLRSHHQHPSLHLLYLLRCCSYSHLRPSCWYTVAYSDDFLRLFPMYVHCNVSKQDTTYTIRYDTRCYINVRSKANMSQLNLPPGNDN